MQPNIVSEIKPFICRKCGHKNNGWKKLCINCDSPHIDRATAIEIVKRIIIPDNPHLSEYDMNCYETQAERIVDSLWIR